jgi:sirohydrochlorin cobaltochelatase
MKNSKLTKLIVVALAMVMMTFTFVGCGSSDAATNDVKVGDVANKAILVVSFGTSYNETRAVTIEAIEKKITDEFSDEYDVRRAFTAQIIIDKLMDRDGTEVDNVEQAMDKLVEDGIGTLIVQPTHVMHGAEYDDLTATVAEYVENFDSIVIGEPLLTSHDDYDRVAQIIGEGTANMDKEGTAIVLMGHGTHHFANSTYACFESHLKHQVGRNYFVGTVEGYPMIDEVITDLAETDATKVVLYPFMVVAGDHANNDMAGEEEDSWATQLKKAGYEVESVLKGLGEYSKIQDIYVEHVQAAIDGPAEEE